jgi:hypothetical protein
MEHQALPGRVASPHLPVSAQTFGRPAAHPPRLWPKLSAETQIQIAQAIAVLIRRMQASSGPPRGETGRADRLEPH